MKATGTTNREIRYLSLISGITVVFAAFALSIKFSRYVHEWLDIYAKTIHFDFYTNMIFLYLAVLLWMIYRAWRRAFSKQKELENVIRSINPDVLMVVDGKEKVIMCNNSVERMLQFGPEEIIDQEVGNLIEEMSPGPSAGNGLCEAIQKDGFYLGEATAVRRDGDTVPLEIIVGNLEGQSGRVLLLRDITERKKAEDAVRKLNDELEKRVRERTAELQKAFEEVKRLEEMKDAFLSSVSHELRTPLTSIRSFSEILLRYQHEDPETRREFLEIINSESERLTRLVNDVLDLARIEAGGFAWQDDSVSPRERLDS